MEPQATGEETNRWFFIPKLTFKTAIKKGAVGGQRQINVLDYCLERYIILYSCVSAPFKSIEGRKKEEKENGMLVSVERKNLEEKEQIRIKEAILSAFLDMPGLRIDPSFILFKFCASLHGCFLNHDEGKTMKIMVIFDPYPGIEEIDSFNKNTIAKFVGGAVKNIGGDQKVEVKVRCFNSSLDGFHCC